MKPFLGRLPREQSEETRKKISAANKGRRISEEQKGFHVQANE